MNTLRKLLVTSLALLTITSPLLLASQPVHAAKAGDNARCECIKNPGQAGKVLEGTWVAVDDDETGKKRECPATAMTGGVCSDVDTAVGSTKVNTANASVCKDANATGNCNPLTDSSIRPGFKVPGVGAFLSNMIRLFFFIAGIVALFYLLRGAFGWVTSGGKEEGIKESREMIQAAVLGLVVMVAVLTVVIIVEQVIFGGKVCLGISCPLELGSFNLVK